MNQIGTSLTLFQNALENNESINIDNKGNWWIEGLLGRCYTKLTEKDESKAARLIAAYAQFLDRLERERDPHEQNKAYLVGNLLLSRCSHAPNANELDIRILSLGYRMGIHRYEPVYEELRRQFMQQANLWVSKQTHYREGYYPRRDAQSVISELISYRIFLERLLMDPDLQNRFFQWTMRDGNPVAPFIELYATTNQMLAVKLSQRVGTYPNHLKFNRTTKDLTCPVETGLCCSLRYLKDRVTLSHNYILSVGEIFKQLEVHEKIHVANITYNRKGLANWNAEYLGPYNPETGKCLTIDLTREKWWEQLDPIDEISQQQLQNMMPLDWKGRPLRLEKAQFVLAIGSSTENNRQILMVGNHGMQMTAIRNAAGNFLLYPFGKQTKVDNRQRIEILLSYGRGQNVYPDGSYFYTDRDHEYLAEAATHQKAMEVLDNIRRSFILSISDKLGFNISSNNCLGWAVEVMDPIIPRKLVKQRLGMNPFQIRSTAKYGELIEYYHKVPKFILHPFLNLAARWFGSAQKIPVENLKGTIKTRSHHDELAWYGTRYLNPSFLLLQRRANPAILDPDCYPNLQSKPFIQAQI